MTHFKRVQQTDSCKVREAYAEQRSKVQSMIWWFCCNHIENKIVRENGEPTANIQKKHLGIHKGYKDRVGTDLRCQRVDVE